ncbi:MAG: hypothetical protein KF749_16065 [Bacteroidetes bacterium]|nr:hypothetical protein [Bacteroidota bacterium]MCW5894168.1 hypothetical protein [Bacteroidota bacterium]
MILRVKVTLLICVLTLAALTGCKKDENPVTDTTTPDTRKEVELRFFPKFGSTPLELNKRFMNANADSVWFTTLKFYLSETALVDTMGRLVPLESPSHTHKIAHEETPNIWMVDFSTATFSANGYVSVIVKGKPGKYRGIKFSVGVPYELNHRDVSTQLPPLGPNSGMYWSWNPGYIFHMMEGKVDSAGMPVNFLYHLGTDNRKVTASLAVLSGTVSEFVVSETAPNVFSVDIDYSKLFTPGMNGAAALNLRQNPSERMHHVGPANLADRIFLNTAAMFSRRP